MKDIMASICGRETVHRASSLAAFQAEMTRLSAATAGAIVLGELAPLAQISLRGDPGDTAFLAAVRRGLELDLPTTPNTTARAGGTAILWMGPDEWLIVGGAPADAVIRSRLNEELGGLHASVIDVGSHRAVLSLAGRAPRTLLMKGCGLDLHPRTFAPGRCAQTTFARTTLLLEQTGDEPAWRLYVRRSFASYLVSWLLDAAEEFVISHT
jgi:sarcosine oxidase, subunit gamma